ncbi:MAG: hypothetical protein HC930_16190 [Hydrococcus sp. SU_1_0]|nr:hypothetical protein [Hydrococcus sp. SU_1_0]
MIFNQPTETSSEFDDLDLDGIDLESTDFEESADSPIGLIDPSEAILSSEDLVEIDLDSIDSFSIDSDSVGGIEAFLLGDIDGDFAGLVAQELTTEAPYDFYEFTVGEADDFNFTLDGLSTDADLLLANEDFEVLGASVNPGTDADGLGGTLEEGTYYLGVASLNSDATDYDLTISSGDFALASVEVDNSDEIPT